MRHSGAAMLMLVLFGSLLPSHVRVAWRRRQNRATGTIMLTRKAVLIAAKAFGLYDAALETFRGWLSGVHTRAGSIFRFWWRFTSYEGGGASGRAAPGGAVVQ